MGRSGSSSLWGVQTAGSEGNQRSALPGHAGSVARAGEPGLDLVRQGEVWFALV